MRKQKHKQKKQLSPKAKEPLAPFDKYALYLASVQSPEADAEFLQKTYGTLVGQKPRILREDFCGTFALCKAWVELDAEHTAIGVDIDPEPLAYGKEHHLAALSAEGQARLLTTEADVLGGQLPAADIACALNFSYFCFKERTQLKKYFRTVYESLLESGIFVIDCFGGAKCCEANEEETEFTDMKFSYFWDQDTFDPVHNYANFYIHFKRPGEKKREKVFSYDWRMWSLPELRDILTEVGFSAVDTYWEESDEDGEGNGTFSKVTVGEECEAWVAYLVARK